MDTLFYAFVVVLFAAVILAVEGFYLWWMSTRGAAARRCVGGIDLVERQDRDFSPRGDQPPH